jgi:hypothetical protein
MQIKGNYSIIEKVQEFRWRQQVAEVEEKDRHAR